MRNGHRAAVAATPIRSLLLTAKRERDDGLVSRLNWVADYSIEVWGCGLGAYTVLVKAR